MIVVDTSALMAVLLSESDADRVITALERADRIAISATTFAECAIVGSMRGIGPEMQRLLDGLGLEVSPVTRDAADRVADAYRSWARACIPPG